MPHIEDWAKDHPVSYQQIWVYMASDGATCYGAFVGFHDHGGTDVTYRFHRLGNDGLPIVYPNGGIRLDLVSGYNLRNATRIGAVKPGQPFVRGSGDPT